MKKIFEHLVKFNKWYLLSFSVVWILCLWLVPIQIVRVGDSLYDISYLHFALRYFEGYGAMLNILAISAIIVSLILLLNVFLKNKYKKPIVSIIITAYILYNFIVGLVNIDLSFPLYAITHLLFALLYFILLYSDKLLIKLQSHKQSPPNTKQKLETQEQQIADLQKQIDELKANHKTEE